MSTNKHLINLYNSHYKTYGATPEGLGWGIKDRTALRYQILASRWNLDGTSILDVGCGFGDFYGFLIKKRNAYYIRALISIQPLST